jgi:hypothetical protein
MAARRAASRSNYRWGRQGCGPGGEGLDMRRHGWALYLGLLAGAPAVAQPPADSERFPPPLDLPGIVVSQPRGSRPTVTVATQPISLNSQNLPSLPDTEPVSTPTATTTIAPINSVPVAPVMVPPAADCPAPANGAACGAGHGSIIDWATFRSQSRQSGHYKPRYTPPLFTWFLPCDPKRNGYGPRLVSVAGNGCATGFGPMVGPAPAGSVDGPVPVSPPVAGTLPGCPDKDALTSFEKIGDGLGFAPGGAPMAAPTTQAKPSKWRPR